jgi:hypothetical protein
MAFCDQPKAMNASTLKPTVACVYDGSMSAYWVVRYAMRLTRATPERTLGLICVAQGMTSKQPAAVRLEKVLYECGRADIRVSLQHLDTGPNLAAAVLDHVRPGPQSFLVCRIPTETNRPRCRLSGTLAENLLRAGHCNVLALRILMPGLLGAPRKLLLPVACNPGEARAVAPFLRLLLPSADELHVFRAMITRTMRIHRARYGTLAGLRAHGRAAVTHFETELRGVLPVEGLHLDTYVRIADDWTGPAVILASQHRCGLVLAGASDRQLAGGSRRKRLLEQLLEHAPCDVGLYRVAV